MRRVLALGVVLGVVVAFLLSLSLHGGPSPPFATSAGAARDAGAVPRNVAAPGPLSRDAPDAASNTQRRRVRRASTAVPAPADTPPGDAIAGTVVDAQSGAPIAGARVARHAYAAGLLVVHGARAYDAERSLASATTDDSGRFVLPSDDADSVLRATADGFAPGMAQAGAREIRLVRGAPRAFEIVDEAGNPVADATVTLRGPGEDAAARSVATSDATGRAVLTAEPDASVLVAARGFVPLQVRVAPESGVRRVTLEPGRSVAGRVVDPAGAPLGGAFVELDASDAASGSVVVPADGRFRFEGLHPGHEYWISASLDGWAGTTLDAVAGDTALDIVLRRSGTVRGVVLLPDGSPARGAEVESEDADAAVRRDGSFELTGLAPGPQEICAALARRHEGRDLRSRVTVDVPEDGVLDGVTIRLRPAPAPALRVRVERDGRPVPGATVWVYEGAARIASAMAGEGGEAVLSPEVAPGSPLRIVSSCGDLAGWSEDLAGWDQGERIVVVALAGAPRIVLLAVDADGRPLAITSLTGPAGESLEADPLGGLPVRAHEPFGAWVHAEGHGDRYVLAHPPHPPHREVVVRLDRAATVTLRVLGAGGRAADVYAAVRLEGAAPGAVRDATPAGGGRVEASSAGRAARLPDETGRIELRDLPPGAATLVVTDQRTGSTRAVIPFRVEPGATRHLGDVHVAPPEDVAGVVTDAAARPIAAARVTWIDPDGYWGSGDVTATGADGSFRGTLPRRGTFHCVVRRPGFGTRCVAVGPATPRPVRVVLAPGGRALVRVPRRPAAGFADVRLRVPGTRETVELVAIPAPGRGGDWYAATLDDLPAGRVELVLRVASYERSQTAEIAAGATTEVVFGD